MNQEMISISRRVFSCFIVPVKCVCVFSMISISSVRLVLLSYLHFEKLFAPSKSNPPLQLNNGDLGERFTPTWPPLQPLLPSCTFRNNYFAKLALGPLTSGIPALAENQIRTLPSFCSSSRHSTSLFHSFLVAKFAEQNTHPRCWKDHSALEEKSRNEISSKTDLTFLSAPPRRSSGLS